MRTVIRRAVAGAAVLGLSAASLVLLGAKADADPGTAPTADQCSTRVEARTAAPGIGFRHWLHTSAPAAVPHVTVRYQAPRVRDVMACHWRSEVVRIRLEAGSGRIAHTAYLTAATVGKDEVRFLDTDAHGVLQATNMPKCADSLGRPCVVWVTQDGMADNSYWLDGDGAKHWLWSSDPVSGNRPPNHWLDEYAGFVEAMQSGYPGQGSRNWHRCWFALVSGQSSSASCPDGSTWLM